MPTLTIEYTTDAERIELERAIASVCEMRRLGATAAHGTVLDACETFALGTGRQLLRDNPAATVQARADLGKVAGWQSKGRHHRTVMTALGPVRLAREYSWRRGDGGTFRADHALGIEGFLTQQATRLLVLAGVEHSFSRAQQVVQEFCGW